MSAIDGLSGSLPRNTRIANALLEVLGNAGDAAGRARVLRAVGSDGAQLRQGATWLPTSSLSAVLRALGRADEAAAHLARARELVPESDHYNRACLEALAGNAEAALRYLEKALAQVPGYRAWAARDPDLASLREHPRFQALVAAATGKIDVRET